MKKQSRQSRFVRAIKKFLLSAFVVLSFTAYALEHRVTAGGAVATSGGATARASGTPAGASISSNSAPATAEATATAGAPPTAAASPSSAAPPTAAAPSSTTGGYRDGTYTGSAVDVNWGNVQVRATIQGGKIANVQFLQYPNDRRTSVRINAVANPELQQEAIQAQSANVDIITGATLTSEGFQLSLQDALSQAQG